MTSPNISTNPSQASGRLDPDVQLFLEKREAPRFFLVEFVQNWLKEYEERGVQWTHFLQRCAKVTTVFTMALSICMSIAIFNLPAWVPWGVLLPSMVILSIVTTQLHARIQEYERDNEFAPFLRGFLKDHSYRSINPIGQWEIEGEDKRLRSNRIAANELKSRNWSSAKKIEERVGLKSRDKGDLPDLKLDLPDVDITPQVQIYAACQFAEIGKREEKWGRLRYRYLESINQLNSGNFRAFEQNRQELILAAYQDVASKETPLHPSLNFPQPSIRREIEALVSLWRSFILTFPRVEKLYEEGKALYFPCKFLEEEEKTGKDWASYVGILEKLKGEIGPIEELLSEKEPPAEKLLSTLTAIHEKGTFPVLYCLIAQTDQIERKLKRWIEDHPSSKFKEIEKTLKQYKEQKVLDQNQRARLGLWLEGHQGVAEKRIVDLPEEIGLTKEFKEWVERYPTLKFQSTTDVFNLACEMGRKLKSAEECFAEIKKEAPQISASAEAYNKFRSDLGQFEKEVLSPLAFFVGTEGKTSQMSLIFSSLFPCRQPLPFVKGRMPIDPVLRERKIEQLHLDELLKNSDGRMVWTNNVRLYLIKVPLILLFAAEGVLAIYVANPWFLWGCCLLAALGELASYYINQRLERLEREKQGVRLQHILRDHPDIGKIPGIRPKLNELRSLQQHYHLEGVRSTWSRALAEGEDILPAPQNLESAKEMIFRIGQEGSELTHTYLDAELVVLNNEKKGIKNPKSERLAYIEERILAIEKVLKERGVEEEKKEESLFVKHIPTPYEKAVTKRNRYDCELDKIVEEMAHLKRKRADFDKASKRFTSLEKRILFLKSQEAIFQDQYTLLKDAQKGDHPRQSQEGVAEILKQALPILKEIHQKGRNDENMAKLSHGPFTRLCNVPIIALKLYYEKLELMLPRAEWALKNLQENEIFGSKEKVEVKIKEIDERLKSLQLQFDAKKQKYQIKNQEVERLCPPSEPIDMSSKERLELLLQGYKPEEWQLKKDGIVGLYDKLNAAEKSAVWWHLPAELRSYLNGEYLLFVCHGIGDPKKCQNLEEFWKNNEKAMMGLFFRIESYHLKPTFQFLPLFFKEKFKKVYEAVTGDFLITRFKQIEQEVNKTPVKQRAQKREELWSRYHTFFMEGFFAIDSLHRASIKADLPQSFRSLFEISCNVYTGSRLLTYCQSIDKMVLVLPEPKVFFEKWWNEKGQKIIMDEYKQVGPRFRQEVLLCLPAHIQEKIQQSELSSKSQEGVGNNGI